MCGALANVRFGSKADIRDDYERYSNSSSDFSPISISRRNASEKVGLSCCVAAHLFTAARVSLDIRRPTIGSWPVAGRPTLFLLEDIDRRMRFMFSINCLHWPRASLTQQKRESAALHDCSCWR